MHIAVDAANLGRDRRGIGRYARAMVSRWLELPDRLRITLLVPDLLLANARRRLVQALGRDDLDVQRRQRVASLRPDLVWYPWNGMTWTNGFPSVATVHDVWPFVSPAPYAGRRRREQTAYLTMAAATRAIIANSHFTRSEILKYLSVPADRVRVVHMGVDPPRLKGASEPAAPHVGAPDTVQIEGARRYVLFVGEDEPRKDLATLRSAMELLPPSLRASTGLLIAGKSRSGAACGFIGASDPQPQVLLRFSGNTPVPTIVAGEVSDDLLDRLYAGAAAFAFPSTYEGFGLPVLEAMAHAVPVVASDAASIPEVGADAALYFPAGDAGALAAALARVLGDDALGSSLGAAGLARAAQLSWDRCSDATLGVFEDAIAMPSA